MKNIEYLLSALSDQIDDGGASYESVVHYNISCPHYNGEEGLRCDDCAPCREICVPCKIEWLNAEIEK